MITEYLCTLDGCVFVNKNNALNHAKYLLHAMYQSGMISPDYYVQTIYKKDTKEEKLRKIRERISDLEKDFE